MVKVVVGKGDEILDYVGSILRGNPSGWLGPPLVETCLDAFFLGTMFCQARFYYSRFPKDNAWIRHLVSSVVVLSIVKTITQIIVVWDINIFPFGNWRGAAAIPWSIWLQLPCQVLMTTAAQSFFVWRAFSLTGRNWYLLVVLLALMLSVVALTVPLTIYLILDPYNSSRFLLTAAAVYIISVVVDVIITAVVCYKLVKARHGFSRQTNKVLGQMLALTLECAAPPAACQLLNTVLTLTTGGKSLWHAVFNSFTPRFYVFALLYSLNVRAKINLTSHPATSEWNEGTPQSGPGQRTQKRSNGRGISVLSKDNTKDQAVFGPATTVPIHVQTGTVGQKSPSDRL